MGRCGFLRRTVHCVQTSGQVSSELILFFLDPFCFPIDDNHHGFHGPLHDWGAVPILFWEGILLHYCLQGSRLATAGDAHHHHFRDISVRVAMFHLSLVDQFGTITS